MAETGNPMENQQHRNRESESRDEFTAGLASVMRLMTQPPMMNPDLRWKLRRKGGAFNAAIAIDRDMYPDKYHVIVSGGASPEDIVGMVNACFANSGLPFQRFSENLLEVVRRDLEITAETVYEVHLHQFGTQKSKEEVRKYQKLIGCDGNLVAMMHWLAGVRPMGTFMMLANDDSRLFADRLTPCYCRHESMGGTMQQFVLGSCDIAQDDDILVSFRPIR
jgi:hypothetical protein